MQSTRIQKRIVNEIKKLKERPSHMFHAEALPDNLYEWHFTLRGMENSPYEEGLYHGVILLPRDYPLKGPDIRFMTENGRFEVGVNICLSNTSYHPESWSPLWNVRNILEALDTFFLDKEIGIGSLIKSDEVRKELAKKSRSFICKKCGSVLDQEKKMLPRLNHTNN